MPKSLFGICIKVAVLLALTALSLFPFVTDIQHHKRIYEPRRSLMNRVGMEGFRYALIGDSAFSSFYVNDDKDSIWCTFEAISGQRMFPGALDGSTIGDLVNAARYVSQKMRAGSTVFVDIIPTRFLANGYAEKNNYEKIFTDLLQEESFPVFRYINYFDKNYLDDGAVFSRKKKLDRNVKEQFDRRWDLDGSFARDRYRFFLTHSGDLTLVSGMKELKEIKDSFDGKGIKVIFVLMPVNRKEIYSYSPPPEADRIYARLQEIDAKTRQSLERIKAPFIDLFYEAIPPECFADLIHTNACGDRIIARALSDYLWPRDGRTP